jgi:AGZA family xanthine/uracil permease-like MFS transporter
VAIGLFPAIAGWGVLVLTQTLAAASIATADPGLAPRVLGAPGAFRGAGLDLSGLVALSQGFMLTSLVWSAASTSLLDRRFVPAAAWMAVGAVLSFFGFMHAGHLGPAGGVFTIGWATGARWAAGYALCAALFAGMHLWARRTGLEPPPAETEAAAVPEMH